MGEKILFLYDTITDRDGVTLTASSALTPVTNLQDISPSRVWRMATNNGEWVSIDAGAGGRHVVDTVALVGFNMTAGRPFQRSTVRVRLADAADMSDASYDQTYPVWPAVSGFGQLFGQCLGGYPQIGGYVPYTRRRIIRLARQVKARFLRLDFSDTLSAVPLELGRIMAGVAFQPERNFSYGWKRRPVDPSTIKRSDGGTPIGTRRRVYHETDVEFGLVRLRRALTQFDDMLSAVGNSRPVLVSLFPDAASTLFYRTSDYGLITSTVNLTGTHHDFAAVSQITVQEVQ
ncbi:MAG: hypothetical protein J0H82_04590 [Alphaproteobacteria bacterium]|jgi:hypothetical protein|nr:hypothetical protein [Alphaproteobacteria bacterium]